MAAVTLVAGCLSMAPDPFVSVGSSGLPESAESLYGAVCSSCHGPDGRGSPTDHLGFDVAPPDFTDCNFATREPNADWTAVIHQGGPARGFSERMPAFGEALTHEQIDKVLAHVRTFCPDDRWPPGELNFPRALVVEKAFPEDEAIIESTIDLEGDRSVVSQFVYEGRFGPRSMFEIVIPFGAVETGGSWHGGSLGDAALGVKHVLAQRRSSRTILAGGAEIILPTGDKAAGLGKGTSVFEPFVSFGQGLPMRTFVQTQIGAEIPLKREGFTDEAFWRAAIGKTVTEGPFGRAWSPIVEVLGKRDLEEGAFTHWHLVPQLQVTLSRRQHLSANLGIGLPIDGSGDDPQWMFYVLWEWFDGGLTDGW